MAKKAPTAKQKAAQKRLAAASRKASKEGKKGKAFQARVKQLLKGTGGGGKGKSKPKGKGKGGGKTASNPSSAKNPKIGAKYTATKRGLKVISPGTQIVLEKAQVKNRVGAQKILSVNTLERVGQKVGTIDYGINLGVEVLDAITDKKFAQSGALTRGSVSAWLPEVYTGLAILDADPGGDVSATRAMTMHRTGVETQNGYDVITGKWEGLDVDNFKMYRILKHGGQLFRKAANQTSLGQRLINPVKKQLKEFDLTI
jgi:hypothetical protein